MKRLRRFILLGFVLMICSICLTGCVRIETAFRIRSDGTIDASMLFAQMDNPEYGMRSHTSSFDRLKETFGENGWKIRKYREDDYSGYILQKNNIPIEDLQTELSATDPDMVSSGLFAITKKGNHYVIDWPGNTKEREAQISQMKEYLDETGGYYRIVVELPNKPIKSNATKVSNGGKTLEWDLPGMEAGENLYAEFSLENTGKGSGMIWYVVGIVILLGVVLAVILILVNEKKKQQAPNAAYGFPQGAGYPMQNMPGSPNMGYPNPNMAGPQNGGYPNPNMPFPQNGGFQGQFGAPQMPQAGGQNPPTFPNPMPGNYPQGVGYPPQNPYGNPQMQRPMMNDDQRFRPKETMGEIPPQGKTGHSGQ